ncbi:signal peptidase II [Candidatus Pelagibacter sp.]|nr:signal peptidase II [Candidatus Pelagibacter sp.]
MVDTTNIRKIFFYNTLIVVLIFLLDRISKFYVLNLYESFGEVNISITSFLNINFIWNKGIAFGFLSVESQFFYTLITVIIILVLAAIILLAFYKKGIERLCYLGIIGGASGNVFDRLYYNSVIDFIDISIKNFHWFIFNIADIFICLGVTILIFLEFFKKNT